MQLAVCPQLCAVVREALYQEGHKTPVQAANALCQTIQWMMEQTMQESAHQVQGIHICSCSQR